MAFKDPIPYDVFAKVDLRVATVISASEHPNADRLLVLRLDDGSDEGRQICAGIKGHYAPEDLVGTQIIIVANLEPRVIRGEKSEGMLCAASEVIGESEGDDPKSAERRVLLLRPDQPLPAGSIVS